MRRCAAALVVILAALAPRAGTAAFDEGPVVWRPPVDGPVARGFDPPAARWAAGHRGVDYAVEPGTRVRAAGDGVVAFAGSVAGSLHVTIAHGGGLRTTYSFLDAVTVHRGDEVGRGDQVGLAGGGDPEHGPGLLHFGLRQGEEYLDPLTLFGPPDLTETVRLVPSEPGAGDLGSVGAERQLLLDVLGPRPLPPWARGGDGESLAAGALGALGRLARGAAGAWLEGALDLGALLTRLPPQLAEITARWLTRLGDQALEWAGRVLLEWGPRILEQGLEATLLEAGAPLSVAVAVAMFVPRVLRETSLAVGDWRARRGRCTASGGVEAGPRAGRRLVVVAGLNSATAGGSASGDPPGATSDLPVRELGYDPGEVTYFSYGGVGRPYEPRHTYGDIRAAALLLDEHLRAEGRARPGHAVDLVGHSLGGVVIQEYLKHVYDPDDPALPPIGAVVTLASPHGGTPLAAAASDLAGLPGARELLDGVADRLGQPPVDAQVVEQIAEGSEFVRRLEEAPLPDHIRFTSIAGRHDLVVPAGSTRLAGAEHFTVDPGGWLSDHSRIVTDSDAVAALRLALEGLPPPCLGLAEAVADRAFPAAIDGAADIVGAIAGGAP